MRDLLTRCFAVLFLSAFGSAALAAGPANRIVSSPGKPDTTLEHSVSGRVKAAKDFGPAPLNHVLSAVTLHFSRTAAQQAAIDKLMAAQQNPQSPQFHHWLTPAQFRQQFGLSDADLAKVSAWLSAQGLSVTGSSFTNTYITASGSVAQVQRAFGVSIHTLQLNGEQHFANVNDPVLPSAIASVVRSVSGLSDFRYHSRAVVRPAFTSSISGSHYLTPGDINTIYDLQPLLASAVNGTGITIAVMGQTSISLADVAAFRSAAGLSANVPNVSYTPTNLAVSTADLSEAQLDVEWAGAIAPSATIDFVAVDSSDGAGGVIAALQQSIANTANPVKILSISYGGCETQTDSSFIYTNDQYYQQAGIQGQTIIGPGGDNGATDCDEGSVSAADGLSVDFPASSPNVTGIGGLMFNEGTGNYWTAAGSTDIISSALSYIPETVWNETATYGSIAAGGGGSSIYFAKPSWQTGVGVPADFARDVPDLALDAAVLHDGYLICVQGSCADGFRDASQGLTVVGGTSVGVPIFAGMLALVEQKIDRPGGLGNINPTIYGLAAGSASQVFHDIISGNNESPCVAGSPNCTSSPIGYSAGVGYDLASGWGSVDGNNMASLWASATPTGTTPTTGSALSTVSVNLPSGTASCGIASGSTSFTVSVAAYEAQTPSTTPATPTGTVQLFVDGQALGSPTPLSSGAATLTLSTASLSAGSHSINVAYSGDATYASSRGNLSPSVSPVPSQIFVPSFIDVALTGSPDFSLTPCQPTITVNAGASGSTPITLTGLNGFSGPVTLTASSDGTLQGSFSFSASPVTVSSSGTASSTFTVNAYYQTPTTTAQLRRTSGGGLRPAARRGLYETGAGGAALASLLLIVLPRRRRYVGLLTLVLSVGAIGLGGCSGGVAPLNGGSGLPNSTTPTSQGYYIINLTATGTNSLGQTLVHTSYLTLAVQ